MSIYAEETLEQIRTEFKKLDSRLIKILNLYLFRQYKYSIAKEYAHQGFIRRCYTLKRCIENIYNIALPDRVDFLSREKLKDLEINLQAFIFNVFGSVDNLAWIWVSERNVTREDGSSLPRTFIGLRRKNTLVRRSFSSNFQEYLSGMDDWFEHVETFRHAIAHGIPVYVPPFILPAKMQDEYLAMESQKNLALLAGDREKFEALDNAQIQLGNFRPIMTHSFRQEAREAPFHPQILVDFMTLEDLAKKMADELGAIDEVSIP